MKDDRVEDAIESTQTEAQKMAKKRFDEERTISTRPERSSDGRTKVAYLSPIPCPPNKYNVRGMSMAKLMADLRIDDAFDGVRCRRERRSEAVVLTAGR